MSQKTSSILDELEHGDPQALLKKIRQVLNGETTLRQEMGLSDAELEALYGVAYSIYQTGRYRDALRVFSLLASMNPYDFRLIFGVASCFQMIEEYMMAAIFYQLAGSLDPKNPSPMLHTAECLTSLKDSSGARVALEETVKRADSNVLYEPVRQRAEIMLANMHG